jgi:hypothetical protein
MTNVFLSTVCEEIIIAFEITKNDKKMTKNDKKMTKNDKK